MTDETEKPEPIAVFVCGSSSAKCRCECPDGPCEHVWDGKGVEWETGVSATCSRCGAEAMAHDLWVCP